MTEIGPLQYDYGGVDRYKKVLFRSLNGSNGKVAFHEGLADIELALHERDQFLTSTKSSEPWHSLRRE